MVLLVRRKSWVMGRFLLGVASSFSWVAGSYGILGLNIGFGRCLSRVPTLEHTLHAWTGSPERVMYFFGPNWQKK